MRAPEPRLLDLKAHFSRSLAAAPGRLHLAAHSHHLWPDVTRDAQLRAWDEAAQSADAKWDHVFGTLVPAAQRHVVRRLGLPDAHADRVAFAPNTHEFVRRLFSALPAGRPPRVLATDGEFPSFERQVRRWEEDGLADVGRVPVEPFASFADRFAARADGTHDLVFFSHVFFGSGHVVSDLDALVAALPQGPGLVVVDGYHAFMARPVDLSRLAERVFYVGGSYKYAMAGEGACFLYCPPGAAPRPRDTGWFASFGALSAPRDGTVPYGPDGSRFLGATFDPTALHRFVAVQAWLDLLALGPAQLHAHALALQERFLDGLRAAHGPVLDPARLVVPRDAGARANFLAFDHPAAVELQRTLAARHVVTDVRGTRLRLGFGPYLDAADVDALLDRLDRLA